MPTRKPTVGEKKAREELHELKCELADWKEAARKETHELKCEVAKWKEAAQQISRVVMTQCDVIQNLVNSRPFVPDEDIPF